jgi:hypothetical protein
VISKLREQVNLDVARALRLPARRVTETFPLILLNGGPTMSDVDSPHVRLQQHIDCQLEAKPLSALQSWEQAGWNEEPGTDVDEAPLKLLALYLLEAIGEKAVRLSIDKDRGATVYADQTYTLPQAPSHLIARGLEILREITGIEGGRGKGTLVLGIRNDSLELIIQKDAGLHIVNIPGIDTISS